MMLSILNERVLTIIPTHRIPIKELTLLTMIVTIQISSLLSLRKGILAFITASLVPVEKLIRPTYVITIVHSSFSSLIKRHWAFQ